jgi:hypothetical protein
MGALGSIPDPRGQLLRGRLVMKLIFNILIRSGVSFGIGAPVLLQKPKQQAFEDERYGGSVSGVAGE